MGFQTETRKRTSSKFYIFIQTQKNFIQVTLGDFRSCSKKLWGGGRKDLSELLEFFVTILDPKFKPKIMHGYQLNLVGRFGVFSIQTNIQAD